jgi:hypothetical protein
VRDGSGRPLLELLLTLLGLAVVIGARHRLARVLLILQVGRGSLRLRRRRRVVPTAPSIVLLGLRHQECASSQEIDCDQAKTRHKLMPRTSRLSICKFFAIRNPLITIILPIERMAGLHRSWWFSAIGVAMSALAYAEHAVSIFRTGWYDSTLKQEPMECSAIAAVRR